jgi:DNA repair exonuclease SbcCD ATPase subunit
MANETIITDLVAQEALDQLAALDKAMEATLENYSEVAKELAKGLKIPVEVNGDLEKITKVYEQQMQRAGQVTQQVTQIQQQQQQVIANTTNTISRQLAEQEKLNKAQREAFTEQQRSLDVADRILGTHEQNVAMLAKYNKQMKDLKAAYKEGSVSAEEYTRRELELKTAKQELQKILNNETKMMQAAEGSYQRLSLQLERLKMAQKQLNEEEKAGAEGQMLEKEIQNLDAHLKDLAADMGEFQRNVGNYAISGKSLRAELKELTMQMAQMLTDGVDPTSEEFLTVAERAGKLKDAMEDAKDTIKDYANDTQALSQGVSVLQTAVGGWQTLAGAMSAFGMENEDAAKATQKLMGIMSLMNGIQKISTEITTNGTGAYRAYHAILKLLGIEKSAFAAATAAEATAVQAETVAATEAAVAESAEATATEAATVASGAHTAAIGVETAALAGATTAATALKLALMALGIGAVIALIVALYETIEKFNEEAEETAKRLEEVNGAIKDSGKSAYETAGELKYYTQVVENFNGTAEEEKKLVDELNQKYGESLGYYQDLIQWKTALASMTETYIDVLKWEAEAQVLLQKYAEARVNGDLALADEYIERFTKIKDLAADQARILKNMVQLHGGGSKPTTTTTRTPKKSSSRTTKADNGADDAVSQMQALIDESNDMLTEWENTATKRAIDLAAVITSTSAEAYEEQVEQVRTLFGVLESNIRAELADALAEKQKEYDEAIAKAKKYNKDTTELEKARITALTALDAEYQRKIEDNNNELNETLESMASQRLAILEEEHEEEIAAITASYKDKFGVLRELYLEELRQTEGNEKAVTEVKKRYARESAQLAEQQAIDVAQASVKGLEEALEMENISAEERERIAEELARAKMALAKAVADAEEKELDRTMKDEQEGRDQRMDAIQKWAQKAGEAISSVGDLFSAMYDNQISKIEEQMELEEQQHDAQIASIEELAERGAITTEEAELRKREAEAATAAKQEQLEKRKAQLQYKQGVMEKANKIAQIAISTALGIMQTFAQLGWPAGIPGAAFVAALGAIQTATALAQPIKAYKEGTKGRAHPGGLAVVGDGGQHELVMLNGSAWITPDSPTLVDLPKGAQVIPNVTQEDVDRLAASLPMSIPRDRMSGQPIIINDYSALEERVAMNTKAIGKHLASLEATMRKELRNQSFKDYINRRT